MRKTLILLTSTIVMVLGSQTPSLAGFGGASPFGQNPELQITIAERQQIKRLYKKTGRAPFSGAVNQKLGDESIFWQLRFEERHKNGKKRDRFGYRSRNR